MFIVTVQHCIKIYFIWNFETSSIHMMISMTILYIINVACICSESHVSWLRQKSYFNRWYSSDESFIWKLKQIETVRFKSNYSPLPSHKSNQSLWNFATWRWMSRYDHVRMNTTWKLLDDHTVVCSPLNNKNHTFFPPKDQYLSLWDLLK